MVRFYGYWSDNISLLSMNEKHIPHELQNGGQHLIVLPFNIHLDSVWAPQYAYEVTSRSGINVTYPKLVIFF